jgi:hypothetical protein
VPENPRIEELRRRVQADPASIAFAALAEEYRRTGRFDDAIETCRTGLQRHPAYLSARVTLGRALIEIGEYDGAREELETVLRSAPENLAAIRGLAQIHERLGHSAEMHPDLHALAAEPIRLAAENRAREAEAAAQAPTALPPAVPLDLSLAPEPASPASVFDSFARAESAPGEPVPGRDELKTDKPFDISSAALTQPTSPAAAPGNPSPASEWSVIAFESPVSETEAPAVAERTTAPVPIDPPLLAFEPATIAFEAPSLVPGAQSAWVDAPVGPASPDPHVAAMLLRLERFLGAIEAARRA